MFSEILNIIPRIAPGDLNKMVNTLNSRFNNVAKKFGKSISAAVKGGGIAAIGMGLVDKVLNPLKETQAAIERTLNYSDDLVTNAKQFGTTSGRLAKLQAFGKSTGLEPEQLSMLMAKFQTSVAEASADPTKQTSVRNFVGETDMAKAFFEFIQSLQKMEKNQQILVQQEVFGEKQILKMADFLGEDFRDLAKFFAGVDSSKITQSTDKLGGLKDYQDRVGAKRDLIDLQTKGSLINKGTINSIEASKAAELKKENERIANFQAINAMNMAVEKISTNIEKLVTEIFTQLPIIMSLLNLGIDLLRKAVEGWGMLIKLFKNSSIFRRIFGE